MNGSVSVGKFQCLLDIFSESAAYLRFHTRDRLGNEACLRAYLQPYVLKRADVMAISSTVNA